MNEGISGLVSGSIATIISHPLDTLKTIHQNNSTSEKFNFKNLNLKLVNFTNLNRLYYGIKYPIFSGMILNGYFFGLHSKINERYENFFLSGAITGVFFAPLVNPFEVYKVRRQMNKKNNYKSVNLFRGIYATFPREIIGCSVWFGCYNYFKKKELHPVLTGALIGTLSWTCSYPIDVVKTRMQKSNNLSYLDAIKKGNLWSGYRYCISRTILFSSIMIPTYEIIINKFE